MPVTDKTNIGLQESRNNKADEFYTMYEDIDAEMSLYADCNNAFENKIVYCPCDDFTVSNFYKYFKDNFKKLKLKKLIATGFKEPQGLYAYYDGETEHMEWCMVWSKCKKHLISESCDFRGDFVKNLIEESDIIVTNPPFSLSKEFMLLLLNMNKKFIVLGNVNAITYKGIFSHFVNGNLRLGGSIHSGDRKFYIPDDYPLDGTACGVDEHNKRYIRVKSVRWFTNMEYNYPPVKHTVLTMNYNPNIHQKYDTYDAINSNTMKEIPLDYYDEIGVPITVLDKVNADGYIEFCDQQGYLKLFKLVGQLNGGSNKENYDFAKPIINGKCKFKRLIIKRV